MAEFGMKNSGSHSSFQGGGGLDWVAPSTTVNYASYSQQPAFSSYGAGTQGYTVGNSFEDEPPLLEELGIDLGEILHRTGAILTHRLNNKTIEELDMGGALLFVLLLGGLHLLMGKLHFGIILGWSVVHAGILWFLVNQLAGVDASEAKGLDMYSCCCLVGYCMAPLAVHSAVQLLLPRGPLSLVLGGMCVLWAAATATKIFVRRCGALQDVKALLMLPCTLLFSAFAMLTIY